MFREAGLPTGLIMRNVMMATMLPMCIIKNEIYLKYHNVTYGRGDVEWGLYQQKSLLVL